MLSGVTASLAGWFFTPLFIPQECMSAFLPPGAGGSHSPALWPLSFRGDNGVHFRASVLQTLEQGVGWRAHWR